MAFVWTIVSTWLFISLVCLFPGLIVIYLAAFAYLHTKRRTSSQGLVVGFFHPYCNSGGGGERVLWCALKALEQSTSVPLCFVVYTGDVDASPADILLRVKERFNLEFAAETTIEFVYLKKRAWIEASRYPRFTLLGQSLGSLVLAWEALSLVNPDVFVDTTGFAFTLPLARYVARARTAAYVHYPTISTDMLSRVRSRRPTYNNSSDVAGSVTASTLKLVYYQLFSYLYGTVGKAADVVMVNSAWTAAHILSLWQLPLRTSVVFPPCDTAALQQLPLNHEQREADRWLLSVGQFRPEKDHSLQLLSLKALKDSDPQAFADVRLALVGSCRDQGDRDRVEALRAQALALGLQDDVRFCLNVPYPELVEWLGRSACGLHTMWNEHFGIGVVEMMAAGAIPIAHNSGGPRKDIVLPYEGAPTGFLASTPREYAEHLAHILQPANAQRMRALRQNGRASVARFSQEQFMATFVEKMMPLLLATKQ